MRKILTLLAIASTFALAPVPAMAQGSFLLGMVVGSAMSSGGTTVQGEANVLYLMPYAADRVTDPLAMRTAYVKTWNGASLLDTFASGVGRNDKYEILQVVRVMDQGNADRVYFWFTYIEKDKVKSLESVKPKAQTQ